MSDKLKAKDFASNQEVRWCPACGDHVILRTVQKVLADLGKQPHNTAIVSGIGCASRFPYYMNTYGFHTIHGRAPTIASGLKLANKGLDVWVIGGDGDLLSIGGNHFIHLMRRNPDITCLLFNNEIYGLTKGQASPTSPTDKVSPSSPYGVGVEPVNALALALGAGAKFVARSTSDKPKELEPVIKEANTYKGCGFVEILQNCVIFNNNAFAKLNDRKTGDDYKIKLTHGQKMIFGVNKDKAIFFNKDSFSLEVANISDIDESEILVHDETNLALATQLVRMDGNSLPKAMGVIYKVDAQTWDDECYAKYTKKPKVGLPEFFEHITQGGWKVE